MKRTIVTAILVLAVVAGGWPSAAEADCVDTGYYTVEPVLYGADPAGLAGKAALLREFADERLAVASSGRQAWRWSCDTTLVATDRTTASHADIHADVLTAAGSLPPRRLLVIADVEPVAGVCGLGVPTSWGTTATAIVYAGCVDAVNPRAGLHELLHTLGAVDRNAPGTDDDGHSSHMGDVMHVGPSTACEPQGVRHAIDCVGDSYYSLAPTGWLADVRNRNIAESPYVTDVAPVDPDPLPDPAPEPAVRLSGSDRYATAVEISRHGWPDGADVAYLATGDNYADALAGAALAARTGSPILLTRRTSLPDVTADELRRLGVRQVVILGGEGAVSVDVLLAAERIAEGH